LNKICLLADSLVSVETMDLEPALDSGGATRLTRSRSCRWPGAGLDEARAQTLSARRRAMTRSPFAAVPGQRLVNDGTSTGPQRQEWPATGPKDWGSNAFIGARGTARYFLLTSSSGLLRSPPRDRFTPARDGGRGIRGGAGGGGTKFLPGRHTSRAANPDEARGKKKKKTKNSPASERRGSPLVFARGQFRSRALGFFR